MNKKYIIFISLSFIFILDSVPSWGTTKKGPDLFQNYTQYFSYDFSKDKSELNNEFITGLKLDLSMLEGRFSIKQDNYNFGIKLYTDKYLKLFPLNFQAGQLSLGGIISKFNDPLLDSSSSGFSGCYSDCTTITSSLPSYSFFSKPISYFVELGYKNENSIFENLLFNGNYTPDTESFAFSSKIKFTFCDTASLSQTFGLQSFILEKYNPYSWYSDTPAYHKDKNLCFLSQINFNIFNFYTTFSLFTYETPFAKFKNIYREEARFKTNHFTFDGAVLVNNDTDIISTENKIITPCTEIKNNIQFRTVFGKENLSALRLGFTSFGKINSADTEHDFKTGLSCELIFPITELLMEENLSYKINEITKEMDLRFISAGFLNTWNFNFLKTETGISSQYYISDRELTSENYKINLNLDLFKGKILNTNSFSFSKKNNTISNKKIDSGLNFNFSLKKINILGKINLLFYIY